MLLNKVLAPFYLVIKTSSSLLPTFPLTSSYPFSSDYFLHYFHLKKLFKEKLCLYYMIL